MDWKRWKSIGSGASIIFCAGIGSIVLGTLLGGYTNAISTQIALTAAGLIGVLGATRIWATEEILESIKREKNK